MSGIRKAGVEVKEISEENAAYKQYCLIARAHREAAQDPVDLEVKF